MRVSISNLAWDPDEDDDVAALLRAAGIDAVDLAPGKYFADLGQLADDEITRVRDRWNRRGLEIVGMQALLFGTTGLNVFGNGAVQDRMLAHLASVCRVAQRLGAARLVFGSPRNRDRGSLTDAEADEVAVPFFRRLGDVAVQYAVVICLEPNPPSYGANYMTTTEAAAHVVRRVAHPAIRLQFDTGALTVNGEDLRQTVLDCGMLIGHAHASEPDLAPLGTKGADHALAGAALQAHRPDVTVAIEMLTPPGSERLDAIAAAVERAVACYAGHPAAAPAASRDAGT